MRIDSHQHFWKYDPVKDAWIGENMAVIRKDFLPGDLRPWLDDQEIDGCIAVQADQSEAETHFLLELAKQNPWIQGVVGWVDLRATSLESRLDYFTRFDKLKGFRHIVQAEPTDDFLLRDDFCSGIALLEKYGFSYDILILPRHLPAALDFVRRFPRQRFVLDHLAKPDFVKGDFHFWEKYIRLLGEQEHVFCKVSGMVTEADWKKWQAADFNHCLSVIVESFGPQRLMFGSDWPVCLLAADYTAVCNLVQDYFASFSSAEQRQIWGGTAERFYLI